MSVNRNVRRVCEPAEQLLGPLHVEPRPEPLEGRERGFELRRRGVLVAVPAERDSQEHSCLGDLVGSADPLPLVARSLEALASRLRSPSRRA